MDDDRPYAAFAAALIKARKEKPDVAASACAALDMVAEAMADKRFTSVEMLREAVRPILLITVRPPIDADRQRHIRTWLDTVASSWSLQQAVEEGEGEQVDLPLPAVTPDDTAASPEMLRAAIEAGDVVQLPGTGMRILRERKPK